MRKLIRKLFDLLHINRSVAFHIQFGDAFKAQKQLVSINNPVIFDAGAFDGRSARLYHQLYANATIYSFEPFPHSFAILQQRKINNRHFVFPLALAATAGAANLYVNNYTATNSLLESSSYGLKVSPGQTNTAVISVMQQTIDEFCAVNKIARIDILKIDVQGGELKVLQGAAGMLQSKKIQLIYFEVEFRELYKDQPLFDDISLFLRSFGYQFFAFYNSSYLRNGQMIAADTIFLLI